MAKIDVRCPKCGGINVIKHGISGSGKQRYYCKDTECPGKSFQIEHLYNGCKLGINETIVAMVANASGIRDTSRVLEILQDKVMSTLKKTKDRISSINSQYIRERQTSYEIQFDVVLYEEVEEAELDEMWSFVFSKANQRWLWLALDHQTRVVLA